MESTAVAVLGITPQKGASMITELITGQPFCEYRKAEGINQSLLKHFEGDSAPAYAFIDSDPTPSQKDGRMFHEYMLEPEVFNANYTVAPAGITDRRKKEYKDWLKEVPEYLTPLLDKDKKGLKLMENNMLAYLDQPEVNLLNAYQNGLHEVSGYFEFLGKQCKARFDVLHIDDDIKVVTIIDLKTTAEIPGFTKDITNFKYYVQDAFYREAVKAILGEEYTVLFYFVAIEKKYPCGVKAFDLDDDFQLEGSKYILRAMKNYDEWKSAGADIKELYKPEIVTVAKPSWL
jgi:hypothetical protein